VANRGAHRPHGATAGYLELGLGEIYLGARVATPLDPRHRFFD
jgi:hypothetical protein